MSPRIKKLIGAWILIFGLAIYAIVVVLLGSVFIPRHWAPELLYYIIAGVAWAYPTKYLIAWMHKEPQSKAEQPE